jgi:hypothetical protein
LPPDGGRRGAESKASDIEDRLDVDDDKLDSELVLPDEVWERGGDGVGDAVDASSESKRVSFGIGPKRACCEGVK